MSTIGRPRRACRQCNTQKVRCSGHKPTCQRCLRLRRYCVYEAVGKGDLVREHVGTAATPNSIFIPGWPGTPPSTPSILISDGLYFGIPTTLVNSLVDVYFSHVYNASLLLHKQTLLRELENGTAKLHVILSVCAFASIFYRDITARDSLGEHGFACEWAESAGKLVLQELQEPHEDNVVTFINLALFWYSQGSWRRSFMLKGNAIQTAHLLGLGIEREHEGDFMIAEMRRRNFWACYLINSFASATVFRTEPSDHVLKLRLPCSDDALQNGLIPEKVSLEFSSFNGSVYAELIRVMTLWTAVHSFVKSSQSKLSSRLTELQEIDSKIVRWRSERPPSLELTPAMMGNIPPDILPKLLLVQIVYHQCLCALHSSIVPLFSWGPSGETSPQACQLSAQIAYEHSNRASQLLESALENLPTAGQIPSFIGYAAYCACAIQMPFMWCSEESLRQQARASVYTNLRMINALGAYWKFIAILGNHARKLYELHSRNEFPIDNEPKFADAFRLNRIALPPAPPLARASVLGHNEILFDEKGKCAKQGHETKDLGVQDTEIPRAQPPVGSSLMVHNQLTIPIPDAEKSPGSYSTHSLYYTQSLPDFHPQPYLDPDLFSPNLEFSPFDNLEQPIREEEPFDVWLDEVGLIFKPRFFDSGE